MGCWPTRVDIPASHIFGIVTAQQGNSMASSSKPTAVHFALAFFVTTTLILALVAYLTAKEHASALATAKTEADRASGLSTALNNADNDIVELKRILGYQFEQVGAGAQAAANTVVGATRLDLVNLGREHVQPSPQSPTVAATLQSLRSSLDASATQVSTQQTGLQETVARMDQAAIVARNERQQIQNSQQDSEAQLQRLITEHGEKLAEAAREIAKWRADFNREQLEKEQLRDEMEALRKDKNEIIADLEVSVDNLRDQLNDLENLSFEKPDAKIVRVDNTTRTVWIDVGSADQLRKQITFSVYTQDHRGVARDRQDIKGKIEVVELRGPHLAQARILSDETRRPIQEGDPIHSPVWSKGLKEYFSFVGVLDLDGDGKSDRELLHEILDNAGAGIEVEVNDRGERVPEEGRLTVKTRFLVIGDIEDPTLFPGFEEKQQHLMKVMEEREALLREARRQGIRVVSFRNFLNYMGFEQQQRLYNPNNDGGYNLKYGARKTITDDATGAARLSTGQTSEIFSKRDSQGSQRNGRGSSQY